jgi:hypothetical protein
MTKIFSAIGEDRAHDFLKYGARRLLTSFAYARAAREVLDEHRRLGSRSNLLSLKLDSGAYTAWTKGKTVDLEAYAEWVDAIRANAAGIDVSAVNLDVIPGTFGNASTPAERIAAMDASMANADRLRAFGIEPIEVFHQDEPMEYLETLLERRKPGCVLAISPRNDVATSRKKAWLDVVYKRLTEDWPRVPRTHILGTTTGQVIQRYPAYSADSSEWTYFEQYGIRVHPRYRTHYFDEDRRAMRHKVGRADNIAQTVERVWTEEQSLAKAWARRGLEFV